MKLPLGKKKRGRPSRSAPSFARQRIVELRVRMYIYALTDTDCEGMS